MPLDPTETPTYSPGKYHRLFHHFADYNRRLALLVASLLPWDSIRIIDVGCGIGLSTAGLREAFPRAKMVGLDPRLDLLALARSRSEAHNVSYVAARAESLTGINLSSQDTLFIKSCLHLFEDVLPLEAILRSMPKGVNLIVVERTPRSARSYPLPEAASIYWRNFFKDRNAKLTRIAAEAGNPEVCFLRYGRFVELPRHSYLDAVQAYQISFLWPFRQQVVSSWVADQRRIDGHVTVLEEFDVIIIAGL